MKIEWCEMARRQFLYSLEGIPSILRHFYRRGLFFPLPEIILQWVEDLFCYVKGQTPHCGVVQMCYDLGISLVVEEENFLREMEKASRKEKSYREFVETKGGEKYILSLVEKIEAIQERLLP